MSDASVTADEAKAAGNAAFKAKDYEEAVKQFTLAIDADPTNHVLYSNRSGAHAAKAAFTDALMDANKCIDLNKDWAKGHSRRGAAYFGLRNWPQSQTAYEKALELDPSSQVVKDELEKVKARRQGSGGAAARAAQTAAASAVGAPVTTGAAPMLSVSALVFGLLYMVPVLGPARALGFYKASVGNILMLFAINLWNAFPKKLATLSDPKFKATQEAQAFMLCIFMALSPPMPFALAPFLAVAFLNVCATAKGRLPGALSFVATKLDYFTTSEGSMQVHAFGAVSEVVVALMSPLLIFVQGVPAALLGFFYFQYVVRRHRTNHFTVQAVTLLTERTDGIFCHRFVPAPLQALYRKGKGLVGFLATRFVR